MLDRFKKILKINNKSSVSLKDINNIIDRQSINFVDSGSDLNEITYYVSLKFLCETTAKMSIHLYNKDNKRVENHTLTHLLNVRPNELMTPTIFKQLLEFNRNHHGNAYVFIKRDNKGKVTALIPLDNSKVDVVINNVDAELPTLFYRLQKGNSYVYLKSEDVLHFKGGLSNGIVGKSVRETLRTTFDMAKSSDKFIKHNIDNGLSVKGIINISTDLSKEKRDQLLVTIKNILSNDNYRDLLPLPFGASVTPLNAKLTDNQFYELKRYTSNQIASAFGIKPIYLNDFTSSSYASSEMQNLSFYVDTMLSIIKQYEEELNYKLLSTQELEKGYHFKFNVSSILRGDLKTQSESIRALVSSGVYTINEARVLLGMPKLKDGDVNLINGTYTKLEDIGKAYD